MKINEKRFSNLSAKGMYRVLLVIYIPKWMVMTGLVPNERGAVSSE